MKCSVENCKNSSRGAKRKPGVSFHYFPMDSEMGIKWLQALGWKNRSVSSNIRICSDHFEECYKDRSLGFKVRLRKDAIPTIFDRDDMIDYAVESENEEEEREEPEEPKDYEEMYKNQNRLVQGLYQELQQSETESAGLKQELQELEVKFSKLQSLMHLMTPFERLVVEQEVFSGNPKEQILKFATSLHNISPEAYDFVKESLLSSLPEVESLPEATN